MYYLQLLNAVSHSAKVHDFDRNTNVKSHSSMFEVIATLWHREILSVATKFGI